MFTALTVYDLRRLKYDYLNAFFMRVVTCYPTFLSESPWSMKKSILFPRVRFSCRMSRVKTWRSWWMAPGESQKPSQKWTSRYDITTHRWVPTADSWRTAFRRVLIYGSVPKTNCDDGMTSKVFVMLQCSIAHYAGTVEIVYLMYMRWPLR